MWGKSADDDANLCKSVGGGPAPPSLDIDHATRLGVSQPPSLDTPTTPWRRKPKKYHLDKAAKQIEVYPLVFSSILAGAGAVKFNLAHSLIPAKILLAPGHLPKRTAVELWRGVSKCVNFSNKQMSW